MLKKNTPSQPPVESPELEKPTLSGQPAEARKSKQESSSLEPHAAPEPMFAATEGGYYTRHWGINE